jgi:hypothetical protein
VNTKLQNSVCVLRWTLGLVVLAESALLAFEAGRILNFSKSGFPHWVRPALAWPEMAAALLFLVPATSAWGARLLLVIFAVAALLHVLHGQYDVGGLLVYAAAAWVVLRDSTHEGVQKGSVVD